MKKATTALVRLVLPAALLLLTAGAALAQTPGTGGPEPQDPPTDPTVVPIDGGVGLLLAAGVGYGLRRLRRRRVTR